MLSTCRGLRLLLSFWTIGDQMSVGLAMMTALGLRAERALGGHVTRELAAVIASNFPRLSFADGPTFGAFTIGTTRSTDQGRFKSLVARFSLKLDELAFGQAAKALHLNHSLMKKNIRLTVVGCDKPETFDDVEPFASTSSSRRLRVAVADRLR